jgi:hypothetical protein
LTLPSELLGLCAVGDGTLVRLTQEPVPPVGIVPVRRGWDEYLDRLHTATAAGPGPVPQPTQGA